MLFEELTWRGLVHQVTDPVLEGLLDREQLVAYGGFDPTSDSLTVGNLVLITTLMRLQQAGHRVIALAGGGTGMIGDPSGRAEERQLLTPELLEANVSAIRAQLERFLDFGAGGALLLDNAAWLAPLHLLPFLRDVGKHFTVNTMIAKESVRARLHEREQGISYTEFTYMLLQAYDFLHLHDAHGCRLQLGGSDQWGNITAGIDLIRRVRGASAYGFTFPLVTKADGTKFGKSEAGNVWLDARRTSPYAMYQFFLRSEDAVVGAYLRYYTFRSREEIEALDVETAEHPERRAAQRALAHDVVALVHGEDEAVQAERASAVLFSEEIRALPEKTLLEVMEDAPSCVVTIGQSLVDIAVAAGLARSRRDARGVVEQGGLYLNNRRVDDPDATLEPGDLLHGRYAVLRRGKAAQCLLRLG
ncbi:MAG TPA: tyrosine--tRNA ligase [Acidimicrobiales bacterium]|nr:tyrosine--tRNA ligase [Acidimicrobiales bacterium]